MEATSHNMLMVEGADEQRVIPELIEQSGIPWLADPKNHKSWIVEIKDCGGIENILKRNAIATQLKASGRRALGVVMDADDDAGRRWQQVRNRCQSLIPDLPDAIPGHGFIGADARGVRFGVWIMPDNKNHGMMETFLSLLRPDENPPLLAFSEKACASAKQHGAPYNDAHADKAHIHTWLAWQDPPGRQLHQAVKERVFRPDSPHARSFVSWFCDLFHAELLTRAPRPPARS